MAWLAASVLGGVVLAGGLYLVFLQADQASISAVGGTLIEAWASMKRFKLKGTTDDDGEGGGGRCLLADFPFSTAC